MGEVKTYTYKEVSEENGSSKTLLVISNKVYDVTTFLNEHPGGEEVLLDNSGKDATECFNDVGHSSDAQKLMKKYYVGDIAPGEQSNEAPPLKDGWKPGYKSKEPENEKYVNGPGVPASLFVGAFLVIVLALLYLQM